MECHDLLKIDNEEYAEVLRQITADAAGHRTSSKRKSERLTHKLDTPLVAVFNYDILEKREAFQVRTVDLSNTGVGFLHAKLEYRDTTVVVLAHNKAGELHKLFGKVAHARLITGRLHLIGMQFDDSIEAEQFVTIYEDSQSIPGSPIGAWNDLVRLEGAALERVLRTVKSREQADAKRVSLRKTKRSDFHTESVRLVVQPNDPTRRALFKVTPLNLSSTGAGFLHGAFLYPGTPCDVLLTNIHGETELTRSTVARCELIGGRIHQVGVKFESKLEVSRFLSNEGGADSKISPRAA